MTTLIPEAKGASAATASSKKPKTNKKVPRCATSLPRCGRKRKVGPQGHARKESAEAPRHARGFQAQSCPRRQQNRQDPRPPATPGRGHLERPDESHRLVAAFRPRLPLRHSPQENGAGRHLHQGRRRRASLLGRGLRPRRFTVLGAAGIFPAAFSVGASFFRLSWLGKRPVRHEGDLHQHHHEVQPMFGPSSQPAHSPIVEPRAQRHRSAQAKEFRFHGAPFVALRERKGKSDRQARSGRAA
jgi:hypothetical protein